MPLCSICGGRYIGRQCPSCRRTTRPRKTANSRGYTYRWQVASKAFLARPENHICRICGSRLAECVDHIVDHHGDETLFWDVQNWQPACLSCNTRKANSRNANRGEFRHQQP